MAVLERDHLPASDVLVAGCGLGQAPRTVTALAALLERLPCPTVVDADGRRAADRGPRFEFKQGVAALSGHLGTADSHRLTVANDTPSRRASCSWLRPRLVRSHWMRAAVEPASGPPGGSPP